MGGVGVVLLEPGGQREVGPLGLSFPVFLGVLTRVSPDGGCKIAEKFENFFQFHCCPEGTCREFF